MTCLCGRPRPDLLVPPDGKVCNRPNPIACARATTQDLKEARAAVLAQGELNCVLVTQNCRIITRNTALEATVRELTAHIRALGGDHELCERSELVARGLSDLPPLEQLK